MNCNVRNFEARFDNVKCIYNYFYALCALLLHSKEHNALSNQSVYLLNSLKEIPVENIDSYSPIEVSSREDETKAFLNHEPESEIKPEISSRFDYGNENYRQK